MVAGELFFDFLATICSQNTLLVLEDGGLFLVSALGLWKEQEKKHAVVVNDTNLVTLYAIGNSTYRSSTQGFNTKKAYSIFKSVTLNDLYTVNKLKTGH